MLFRIRQIVYDAFALEVFGQRLPAPAGPPFLIARRSAPARLGILVIVILTTASVPAGFGLPRLPGGCEQRQLIGRQLLALAVAPGIQQLPQKNLNLVPLGELVVQLRHQIQHHLL